MEEEKSKSIRGKGHGGRPFKILAEKACAPRLSIVKKKRKRKQVIMHDECMRSIDWYYVVLASSRSGLMLLLLTRQRS